tara:strand:- start:110 stop:364 length:255 start_codon:yes stop_codon:yes gene_type:complete
MKIIEVLILIRAYILIEMTAGKTIKLVRTLESLPFVIDIGKVTGPYDAIVVIEGNNLEEISNTVEREIHPIDGVVRTTTCVSLK